MEAPSVRLKCGARDVRVTRQGIRPMNRRADAFARAIMRRYAFRPRHRSRVGLAFRRHPASSAIHPSYTTVKVHLAPRLNLTLIRQHHDVRIAESAPARLILRHRQAAPPDSTDVPGRRIGRRPVSEHPVDRLVRRVQRREVIETTVRHRLAQRLVQRAARTEGTASPEVRASLRAGSAPDATAWETRARPVRRSLARPVQRVIRRPALLPEIAAETSTRTARPPAPQPPVGRPGAPAEMPSAVPAPIDVHRLTDQVMQNIDRRLFAHRERRGRI